LIKKIDIPDLKETDRVFKNGRKFVKIRLQPKDILSGNKRFGANALSIALTASICDNNGKALPDSGGRHSILPHVVTIPLMEQDKPDKKIKETLDQAIKNLVEKALKWDQARAHAEKVIKGW